MAKRKKKNGYGKGTFIDTAMFLSPAYMSLGNPFLSKPIKTSSASNHILHALLLKRQFFEIKDRKTGQKRYERTDDNKFTLTYKELMNKPFNFTQPRITRGFDELLAKGFIKIINPGGCYEKDKATYALVDDWMNWRQLSPPIRTRPKDVRRGYQGKKMGVAKK